MKKTIFTITLAIFLISATGALWAAEPDVQATPSCKYCGMNRDTYAHSRMLIEYSDGAKEGTCSLHCASVDMVLNLDKAPRMIGVGDYNTKALINAETAFWVIGGNKPGVMTKTAKWAFADKAAAEKFQQSNGGRLAGFEEALEASYKDLAEDTKMIRERRKVRSMQMMKEHKP
jgi:copper chaperone NosL